MRNLTPLAGALLALSLPLHAQGQVWVVDDDPGPGVDFQDLQPAVDAAGAGDLLLVKDGVYKPFSITGTSLAVVADEGASVLVEGVSGAMTTLVSNVGTGDEVVIRGLHFRPPQQSSGDLVRLESSPGVVWLEDVELEWIVDQPFVYFLGQDRAMGVDACDRVVLTRTEIHGLSGAPQGQGLESGSIGLRAEQSALSLFDCDVDSGLTLVMSAKGRPGLDLDACFALLRGCRVTGGPGGEAGVFGVANGGDGGPGAYLKGASVLWSVGSTLLGGPGGGPGILGGMPGAMGPPYEIFSGTVNEHAAAGVLLETDAVVRDDQLVSVRVTTEPDARVFLLTTTAPDPVFREAFPGTLAVGPTPYVNYIGRTDAQGELTATFAVPKVGGTRDFKRFTVQVAASVSTGIELANPSVVHVVRSTF